jgi:hypothetical protein
MRTAVPTGVARPKPRPPSKTLGTISKVVASAQRSRPPLHEAVTAVEEEDGAEIERKEVVTTAVEEQKREEMTMKMDESNDQDMMASSSSIDHSLDFDMIRTSDWAKIYDKCISHYKKKPPSATAPSILTLKPRGTSTPSSSSSSSTATSPSFVSISSGGRRFQNDVLVSHGWLSYVKRLRDSCSPIQRRNISRVYKLLSSITDEQLLSMDTEDISKTLDAILKDNLLELRDVIVICTFMTIQCEFASPWSSMDTKRS